jgi:hypothetical protein
LAKRDFTDHAREAGSLVRADAGKTEVFVDDADLIFGPAELFCRSKHIAVLSIGDYVLPERRRLADIRRCLRTCSCAGSTHCSTGNRGPVSWADAKLLRYADDIALKGDSFAAMVVVSGLPVGVRRANMLTRDWTPELTDWIEARIEGKFGLEINREKTRIVEVKAEGKSLYFLGYAFRYDRDVKGCPRKYLNVIPSEKSLAREREKLREMTAPSQSHVPLPQLGCL